MKSSQKKSLGGEGWRDETAVVAQKKFTPLSGLLHLSDFRGIIADSFLVTDFCPWFYDNPAAQRSPAAPIYQRSKRN